MNQASILIVDDELHYLETIVYFIEQSNEPYTVYQAFDSVSALRIAIKTIPDLIITDWAMPPGDSGIELIKQLKANPTTQHIPVIMCTGIMTTSENLKTALDSGAVDFIRKPIDEVELLARIRSMLLLSSSYARERQLNEAKTKILSIIGHDLKGPIGNMQYLLDLILSGALQGERLEKFIHAAKHSLSSALGLLDNLLQWSQSQRGILKVEPLFFNLGKLINDCVILLSEKILEKSILLTIHVKEEISVYADQNMTGTVVRNLIANALKFSRCEGEITVNATLNEGFVIVSVIDNGVGIPQDHLRKLFNPDYHLTTFGTLNEIGSGLGLKICREFVEMNGGLIWAESEEKNGSAFYFSIPAVK